MECEDRMALEGNQRYPLPLARQAAKKNTRIGGKKKLASTVCIIEKPGVSPLLWRE